MIIKMIIDYPFQKEPCEIEINIPNDFIAENDFENSDNISDFLYDDKIIYMEIIEDYPNWKED